MLDVCRVLLEAACKLRCLVVAIVVVITILVARILHPQPKLGQVRLAAADGAHISPCNPVQHAWRI